MEESKFVHVSEEIAGAILEREQVHPAFLHRNEDNSFKATFTENVTDLLRSQLADVDDTILVFEPDETESDTLHFGFVDNPTD